MKIKLIFLVLLVLATWVSMSQIHKLIGGNPPSSVTANNSAGTNLTSEDVKGLKTKHPENINALKTDDTHTDISKSYAMINQPINTIKDPEISSPVKKVSGISLPDYQRFGEDKIDIGCSEWIGQKERSLSHACQLTDW